MQNSLKDKKEIKTRIMTLVGENGREQQVFVPIVTLPDNTRVIPKTQIAKMLGVSYNTVLKLCREQILCTTVDGKVTEQSVADYLNNNPLNDK